MNTNFDKNWGKPSNRFEYSSEDGTIDLPKEGFRLPSENWRWQSGWNLMDRNSENVKHIFFSTK